MKLKKLICIVMISVLGVLSFAGCAKKQDEKKTETSSEASTQEASAQVFAMDTYMTVSYTHLDVYKRQINNVTG